LIYILSFLRRLKVKSAFYFSLLVAFFFYLFGASFFISLFVCVSLTLVTYFLGQAINFLARRQATGIECKICSFENCHLLYPAKHKTTTPGDTDKGSFACTSYDHGHHPDIYYCPNCKNGFLKNILVSDLQNISTETEKAYKEIVDQEYILNIDARYKTYQAFLKKYHSYFSDQSILEIGCYYGAFYHEGRETFKDYLGIEPSIHACNYLKETYPEMPLFNGTVEEFLTSGHAPGKQWETIVLFDVIEHLSKPIDFLKKIHPLLKPGGYVFFSTINIESSISIFLGPFWPWFMDMHYYYFSDRGYVDMLNMSGFQMKAHHHFAYWTRANYFFKKIFSLLGIRYDLAPLLKKLFSFYIPIKLGDTVLIIGKKTS
jgi:2-polyprenyl-3-methyl-5-hydroxy-6-metoxy-1,4-benzoquinol methylase